MQLSLPPSDSEIYQLAIDIVSRLQDSGYTAYLAGGCVRDMLLHNEPADYDIATDALPEAIHTLFDCTKEVGKVFGVMLVRIGEHNFEIATFRTDHEYKDGRHPSKVTFSTPQDDARRRDFTINALFFDPASGKIHDYVDGIQDLSTGTIRAVGCPEDRFKEDHLRMLRAVRFAARFEFAMDPETLAAIRRNAPHLARISKERVTAELNNLFGGPRPGTGLSLLISTELWTTVFVFPAPAESAALSEQLNKLAPLAPQVTFAAILFTVGVSATVLDDRLRLSRREQKDISGVLQSLIHICEWPTLLPAQQRRIVARSGFNEALCLMKGLEPNRIEISTVEAYLKSLPTPLQLPEPLITGADLIQAGLRPGPDFSAILDKLFDRQLESDSVTHEDLIHMALELSENEQG